MKPDAPTPALTPSVPAQPIEGAARAGAVPDRAWHTMPAPVADSPLADWLVTLRPELGGAIPAATAQPALVPSGNDLYALQWHFAYLGDIEAVWDEYSGAGVHVGIYDDGVQTTHPDLAANYDASRQVTVGGVVIDALDGPALGEPHGTSVAGLIAAANNGIGTVGVAFGASITGVTIFGGPADINESYDVFLEAVRQSAGFDVINHSWGRYPGFLQTFGVPLQDAALHAAWFDALALGRGGLGTVQVKAAGNSNLDSNGDGGGTSRATIVVGAHDADGDASWYSSYGANLLISAPSSGNTEAGDPRQVTTDLLGGPGYAPGDWTDAGNGFGGTSGATPLVTATIALMLDATPTLGWRDVQTILAYSAHETGSGVGGARLADEDHDWFHNAAVNWNGGGLHFSEDYGYGGVDAYNAVRMAEVWPLFGAPQASANEVSFTQSTTLADIVLEDLRTTDIVFTFGGADFEVEFVDVGVSIAHESVYHLDLQLVSPGGTTVTLTDFFDDAVERGLYLLDATRLDALDWTFGAQAFRGEDGNGEWTLRITDKLGLWEGTLASASITLHGRDDAADTHALDDDVYHYTSEIHALLASDPTRTALADTDTGEDWLNLAAMPDDLIVDLDTGVSTGLTTIAAFSTGTAIEHAVAGDGDDTLLGNALSNRLHGMRGNDALSGADGDDTLSGGRGADTLEGGEGRDTFLFDAADGAVDIVRDFAAGQDVIALSSLAFAGLAPGALAASAFASGNVATTAAHRILYETATGLLRYDADGDGTRAAVILARFDGAPGGPSHRDIIVEAAPSATVPAAQDRIEADASTRIERFGDGPLRADGERIGTDEDDTILGGDGNDAIEGRGGNDRIDGGDGDDLVDGGDGSDLILGNDGNDTLQGGAGYDVIRGDDGDDVIDGGAGFDDLSGGDGNDVIRSGGGFASIFGGGGDDFINADDEYDDSEGYVGSDILGGSGNDTIIGSKGGDFIQGQSGNDTLIGGDEASLDFGDGLEGGLGDDVLIPGGGNNSIDGDDQDGIPEHEGYDIGVFSGRLAEYRFGTTLFGDGIFLTRTTPGIFESTFVYDDVELLRFSDVEIDLVNRPMVLKVDGGEAPVTIDTYGYELSAYVTAGTTVDITDHGPGATMTIVSIDGSTGPASIASAALEEVYLANLSASVTIDGAARARVLSLTGMTLGGGDAVTDANATVVDLTLVGSSLGHGPSGEASLVLAATTELRIAYVEGENAVAWSAPNAIRIDASGEPFGFGAGNYGTLTVETALDDTVLASAGGTAGYAFVGGDFGAESVQFGNLGRVTVSNDGTTSEDAPTGAGLGLRGAISLGGGDDTVRVLGSQAFRGGLVDAGEEVPNPYREFDTDTLRLTFAVAGAIGDISDHIANFEILRLDAPVLRSTVDLHHFDDLARVLIAGGDTDTGSNTLRHLADGATVVLDASLAGSHFGRIAIDLDATSRTDVLHLVFTGAADPDTGAPASTATGIVQALDAETVHLDTGASPAGSLALALDLDVAQSLLLSGGVGIDLNTPDSDIRALRLLDASGVWGTGAAGAVSATATASGVEFTGGAGDDRLTGASGADVLRGGDGADVLVGGAGDDTLEGGSHDDVLEGGRGDDTLDGGDSDDVLRGDLGDDALDGGLGDDILEGSTGNDHLVGGRGEDCLDGGSGNDRLEGGASADALSGGSGNDALDGGTGTDILFGDAGNDLLDGGNQNDDLHGGGGDDTLAGGADDDVLHGDEGDDVLRGDAGDDALAGGGGIDRLFGGAGADRFVFEALDDSGPRAEGLDRVEDFQQGLDRFDLSALDGDSRTPADDAFVLVDEFSGHGRDAGEIRVSFLGADTLVEADVNGDADADLAFLVTGHHELGQGDFLV